MPGADIPVAVDKVVEGGFLNDELESFDSEAVTVGVGRRRKLDLILPYPEFLDLALFAIDVAEGYTDRRRMHLLGIERILDDAHLQRAVLVIFHPLDSEERAPEPESVSHRHDIVEIPEVEIEIFDHLREKGRTLQDEDLIVDLLGNDFAGKLGENGKLGVGSVRLVEHDPGCALVLRRLEPEIGKGENQGDESAKRHPPFQSPAICQEILDIEFILSLLLRIVLGQGVFLFFHI